MSTNHPLSDAEALAALDWYRAAGVDVAVGDDPVDRFAASAVVPARRILPGMAPAAPAPVAAPAVPLNSDPSVIGKTIRLGGRPATVVGVLEPSIPYPAETEIIANVVTSPHHLGATMVTQRVHRMTELFGRLAPGASVEDARAELAAVHGAMMREHPESYSAKYDMRLAVTPLRKLLAAPTLIAARRNLGLLGFGYIALHFLVYFWWDREGSVGSTVDEIALRRYLWFGFGALVLMLPLAITSTDAMVARLGAKRWKLLHRLIYVIVPAGVLHFYILVKADTSRPKLFAWVVGGLLGFRLRGRRGPLRSGPESGRDPRCVARFGGGIRGRH